LDNPGDFDFDRLRLTRRLPLQRLSPLDLANERADQAQQFDVVRPMGNKRDEA
jgi:hypothetical protein